MAAYVNGNVDDPDQVEDLFQDSLLNALQNACDLRDEGRLIPWSSGSSTTP